MVVLPAFELTYDHSKSLESSVLSEMPFVYKISLILSSVTLWL
jgi:hypothetical protein